ncbi:MAG: hypothetical protein JRH11_08480 [Deltaproteobacteria bacterium]|nr:hypothetical protein [Deltaproteobacteria bacterium]
MPRLHSITFFGAVTAALLFALSGCNTQSHLGGDDSGVGTDGGGEACGSVTCGDGLVCCNASCGICAAPGAGCIALACGDGGTPPPTDGGTGEACGPVTCGEGTVCCNASCGICAAPGVACISLACEDSGTPPPTGTPCGGFAGDECGEGMFCEHAPGSGCGFDDGTGTCQPMPTGCARDCPGVCGCDGATYCNACNAAAVGVSVMHEGTCDSPVICRPMEAVGDRFCDLFLGFAWNGTECAGLSGCSCVGADCGSLTSFDACQAAHVECPSVTPPGPSCGGLGGASCGPGEYCDYPDGSFCGGDDSLGVCVPWADPACIEIYSPVCGCDGVTYDNSCLASAAGQDVLHTGVCSTP